MLDIPQSPVQTFNHTHSHACTIMNIVQSWFTMYRGLKGSRFQSNGSLEGWGKARQGKTAPTDNSWNITRNSKSTQRKNQLPSHASYSVCVQIFTHIWFCLLFHTFQSPYFTLPSHAWTIFSQLYSHYYWLTHTTLNRKLIFSVEDWVLGTVSWD